jgi:hypothetical protein
MRRRTIERLPEKSEQPTEKPVSGHEIADFYRVDVHTVRRWRYDGCPHDYINAKLVLYYPSQVDQWLRNRQVKLSRAMTTPFAKR